MTICKSKSGNWTVLKYSLSFAAKAHKNGKFKLVFYGEVANMIIASCSIPQIHHRYFISDITSPIYAMQIGWFALFGVLYFLVLSFSLIFVFQFFVVVVFF
jgi:hypothetical protein